MTVTGNSKEPLDFGANSIHGNIDKPKGSFAEKRLTK
jgi:hypothetical protein